MIRCFVIALFLIISVNAETLFEVKDSSNNKVIDVSTDGMRVYNLGDTLMVISASTIKANIGGSKGLSRTFSVSTTTSKKGLAANVLEVSAEDTKMREGSQGEIYTDFSPENIFLGLKAGISNTPGVPNTYSGKRNIFLGNASGKQNTSGFNNIMIGDSAGVSNNSGIKNIMIGNSTGFSNTMGSSNIYIGYKTGYASGYASSQNIIIGNYAGSNNATNQNLFIGEFSGEKNTSGNRNSFLGFDAGQNNSTGSNNTYVGQMAGMDNLQSSNTMVGYWSGGNNTNGTNNSFFGYRSGVSSTGSNNVFIGYQAGESNTGASNLMLGYQAGMGSGSLSNKLYIANSSTSTPLIKGTFPNTDLTFTADQVYIKHPTGTTNTGLYIQNSDYSNSWHFYQNSSSQLTLYYNTSYRGAWDITTGAYTGSSDRKLKKNIDDLGNVTDKVMKLQPKRYNFNSQKDGEKKYIGLIAQDVKEIFPEFVYYNTEEDLYTMDYAGLSVIAIQAIKELKNENAELKERITELESLKTEIEQIKKQLSGK